MKATMILAGKVYRKKEPTDYRLNNGATGKSYKIIFDDFENTEDLKISEEAYNFVNDGDVCLFEAVFDTASERKELKIVRVLSFLKEAGKVNNKDIADAYCKSIGGQSTSEKLGEKSDKKADKK